MSSEQPLSQTAPFPSGWQRTSCVSHTQRVDILSLPKNRPFPAHLPRQWNPSDNDDTIMPNPGAKGYDVPHVKDVFPEYEMDEFEKDDDVVSRTSTMIIRLSIETPPIETKSPSDQQDTSNSTCANTPDSIDADNKSIPKVSRTASLEDTAVQDTTTPPTSSNSSTSRLALKRMGSVANKQKRRKSFFHTKTKSIISRIKRIFRPKSRVPLVKAPVLKPADVSSLENVDLQELPQIVRCADAKMGARKISPTESLYIHKPEDSATTNGKKGLYSSAIPGRRGVSVSSESEAWKDSDIIARRTETKSVNVMETVPKGKNGGVSALISMNHDGKLKIVSGDVKVDMEKIDISDDGKTITETERAKLQKEEYFWTELLEEELTFGIPPTPCSSPNRKGRPHTPSSSKASYKDIFFGLPASRTWYDIIQPWHLNHRRTLTPPSSLNVECSSVGSDEEKGDGKSDTSDDFVTPKGKDSDLDIQNEPRKSETSDEFFSAKSEVSNGDGPEKKVDTSLLLTTVGGTFHS
jgi:hypothetical protein